MFEFVNVQGAQESFPRNRFCKLMVAWPVRRIGLSIAGLPARQAENRILDSLKGLQILGSEKTQKVRILYGWTVFLSEHMTHEIHRKPVPANVVVISCYI